MKIISRKSYKFYFKVFKNIVFQTGVYYDLIAKNIGHNSKNYLSQLKRLYAISEKYVIIFQI